MKSKSVFGRFYAYGENSLCSGLFVENAYIAYLAYCSISY